MWPFEPKHECRFKRVGHIPYYFIYQCTCGESFKERKSLHITGRNDPVTTEHDDIVKSKRS